MQLVDVPLPPPPVDPQTARGAVEAVLARPEYADIQPGLLDRAWGAVTRAVGELLSALTGTVAGSVIGYLLLGGLAALVVSIGVRTARSLRRETAAAVATAVDVGRAPEEWLADAEEHEAAGRWRDGVRCRYRALVAELAGAGTLDEVAGRTAGEYLAAVRAAAPAAAEPFAVATAVFEEAWYGHGDVGEDDAAAFRAAGRATADAVGSASPASRPAPTAAGGLR